jgi:hypothetical protein
MKMFQKLLWNKIIGINRNPKLIITNEVMVIFFVGITTLITDGTVNR